MPKPRSTPRPARSRAAAPAAPEIAVLSDIHSNLHALEAVLAECRRRGIRRFFCLGDIVGYGAFPAECLRLIRALRCPVVLGNHDYYVATGRVHENLSSLAAAGIAFSIQALPPAARRWLGQLPEILPAPPCTLVHATLDDPGGWEYIVSPSEARRSLRQQTTPLCFYGHTHRPALYLQDQTTPPVFLGEGKFRLTRSGRALINCGSVGQPRNEDPRAQFGVFDPEELTVEFAGVAYDTEAAGRAILAAGLPEQLAERLQVGV